MDDRLGSDKAYVRALSDDSWYVHGSIGPEIVEWLIDSGAGPSLLDYGVYTSLKPETRPNLVEYSTNLLAAGGTQLKVYGEITIGVTFGKLDFPISLVVADLGGLQGILGSRFIRSAEDVVFDLKKGTMVVGSEVCYLHEKSGEASCYVRIEQTVEVPCNHEIQVIGRVSPNWPLDTCDKGLIEVADDFDKKSGLIIPRTLVKVEDWQVMVTLSNFNDHTISVEEGTIVGALAPVEYVRRISSQIAATRQKKQVDDLPEYLRPLIDTEQLTEDQIGSLCGVVYKNQDLFARPEGPVGRTSLVKHTIDTCDARPIKRPPRRFPDTQQRQIEEELGKMMEQGIIQESDSPWASQVVLVRKKDGSTRFCVDYRHLNAVTKKDAYPLPNITDCMDTLEGATWFCTLDCASGYWQVEVDERDREKTAFATRKGLFEFCVMPFGLTNAPATFERLMERVLRCLQWEMCLVYLDDVILFAATFDAALDNLEVVFGRLRDAGLKLKAKKCDLMKRKVAFLGHIVDAEGVHCDPAKVDAVRDWETPTTVTEIRSFLGLASYYRRFVPKFSTITSPLTELTKKGQAFEWTDSCDEAFGILKQKLIESPVLSYPSRSDGDMFVLDTDASGTGIGAVLSQVQDGKEKVISYASRMLTVSQRKYCVTYRELLAVVVFVKQFRHYLLGRKFKIRTDHASLRWLSKFKDAEGMVGRWITYLSTFDFDLEHRRGVLHGNADALSRKPPKKWLLACKQSSCIDCPIEPVDGFGTQGPGVGNDAGELKVAGEVDRDHVVDSSMTGCVSVQTSGAHSIAKDSIEERVDQLGHCCRPVVQPEVIANDRVSDDCKLGSSADNDSLLSPTKPVGTASSLLDCDIFQVDRETDKSRKPTRQQQMPIPHSGTHDTEHHTYQIPGKLHPRVMVVTDQNGGQPPDGVECNWLEALSRADLQQLQEKDVTVGKVLKWKRDHDKPDRDRLQAESNEVRALCAQWASLEIVDGSLHRRKETQTHGRETITMQLVAPHEIMKQIFDHVHSSKTGGHLGINRTVDSVRRRFYWPGCKSDIKIWCQNCTACAQVKAGPRHKSTMQHVPSGSRFDRVFMDILGELPETDRGNKYIVVITDAFTKWTQALPLPDQTAQTVADALMTNVFSLFGVPRQIHTDQGRNFESNLFKELCELLGIKKSRTTPYRPQSDGQTERFNRTLQQMLKTYVNEERDDWDDHLPYVMMAYRATVHDSTNQTPNLMFMGTENILPIDLVMGPPPNAPQCPIEYVEWLKRTIVLAHESARKSLVKSTARQKRNYDLRAKPIHYRPGDFVWRWYPPTANRKLGKGWVGPYKVIGCPSHVNCEVQREQGGRIVRVHIDHLKLYHGEDPSGWSEPETSESENDCDDEPDSDPASATLPTGVVPSGDGPQTNDIITSDGENSVAVAHRGVAQRPGQRHSRRKRKPPDRLDL